MLLWKIIFTELLFFFFSFPNEPTIKASLLGKPQIVCPQLIYYLNSSKLVLQLILISFWGKIILGSNLKGRLQEGISQKRGAMHHLAIKLNKKLN